MVDTSHISVKKLDACRICGSKKTKAFLTLSKLPLPVDHKDPEEIDRCFQEDLTLYWCPDCLMVQTLQDADLDAYYASYQYVTSSSPLVERFMKKFAAEAVKRFSLKSGDAVLEIGSGDGAELAFFKGLDCRVLGFEPSKDLVKISASRGIPAVQKLFDEHSASDIPKDFDQFQIVTCQYTFDHLPHPVQFLKSLIPILDPERGVVIIEVHDLEKMVERNEACLFTHEHATYATVESMANLFKEAGMKLICSDLVPESERRGNSLIVAGAVRTSPLPEESLAPSETLKSLRSYEAYGHFADNIRASHKRLKEHVLRLKSEGKKVAGYGGVGRGVNTLSIAGLKKGDLTCVYDQNKKLQGLAMPGSGLLIKDPSDIFEHPVDEVIVFSYGYLEEINKFLEPYVKQGGRVTSMLEYLK